MRMRSANELASVCNSSQPIFLRCRPSFGATSIMCSAIRRFMAEATKPRPMHDARRAARWTAQVGRLAEAGHEARVQGGTFTAILRADRLSEALAASAGTRRDRVSALAASWGAGQAGDRAGRARDRARRSLCCRGWFCTKTTAPTRRRPTLCCGGGAVACPVRGRACRFRPAHQTAPESCPKPGPFRT